MEKVNREIAKEELNKWLDFRLIKDRYREDNEDLMEMLLDMFEEGGLILNEDYTLTYELIHYIGEDEDVTSFNFKPRIKQKDLIKNTKGNKPGDGDARILSYMATLTGKPKDLLLEMDTIDYNGATAIVSTFL